ncbi:MAG: competence/damage-inducible protein A [Phycisphaeraceae bacterium]|nr:competence/damage-inducible protein A [Phycisphaeraceae bacterium]
MSSLVHAHAAILSIGDELVRGQTLDTNSRLLSSRLMQLGIETVEHATVGDDLGALVGAIKRLASRAPLVIATGGLGPTDDDLTRDALAAVLGDRLVEDPDALAQLSDRLRSRGREVYAAQRMQALRPERAQCLRNDFGTAPGLFARIRVEGAEADIFCLPGPPGELVPMWESLVVPQLRPEPGLTIRTRFLKLVGIPEAEAASRVPGIMARDASPQVGITASGGILTWRIRYRGPMPPAAAESEVDRVAQCIIDAMGEHVFATGEVTLAAAVLDALKARTQMFATVESCTGGLLGAQLTAVPGSSAAFAGGFVTYTNALKQSLVGVRSETLDAHGAVSAECAREMAAGGVERTGADWCVSITGIAGPDGGTAEKPVGTVHVGLAKREHSGARVSSRAFRIPGGRDDVRERSAMSALAMLWFALRGKDPPAKLLWEQETGSV